MQFRAVTIQKVRDAERVIENYNIIYTYYRIFDFV